MNLAPVVAQRLKALLPAQTRIVAAVSGGPDSIALAHALKTLSWPFVIAHIDHQIRAGSGRDAVFVAKLARHWHVPFRSVRVHVPSRAQAAKQGLEEAAREARYEALLNIARQEGCSAIVTGHTADDQAETVLMHWLRGTGATGLAGMAPVRPLAGGVCLVRPLLAVPRRDVEQYLRRYRLKARNDPSNRSLRFFRNRIRHRTLPELNRLAPGLRGRLTRQADVFREEEDFWVGESKRLFSKTARKNNGNVVVDLKGLLRYHKALQRRLLRWWMDGLSFQDVERALAFASSPGPTSLQLNRRWALRRKRQQLILQEH